MTQATPATSGGTNSGSMLTAAMKRLHGVLVRTTIHENASPIVSASAVPPPQAISEFASASRTFGLASTATKLSSDGCRPAIPSTTGLESVSAPMTQHQDRIDDQEGEDREQQHDPGRGDEAAAPLGAGARRDGPGHERVAQRYAAPICQCVQSVPLMGPVLERRRPRGRA